MQHDTREPEPMSAINTTPLVDVMLVLLIMFIITIPVQSHAVKMDLPIGPPLPTRSVSNMLVVTEHGALLWNGQQASDRQIQATLAATQRMTPIPELHLRPEAAARYERVDEVLAMTKRAQVERMGFVGNEAYRNF